MKFTGIHYLITCKTFDIDTDKNCTHLVVISEHSICTLSVMANFWQTWDWSWHNSLFISKPTMYLTNGENTVLDWFMILCLHAKRATRQNVHWIVTLVESTSFTGNPAEAASGTKYRTNRSSDLLHIDIKVWYKIFVSIDHRYCVNVILILT